MIAQAAWFPGAQDALGFGGLIGSSMSDDDKVAGLYGGFILNDAVLRDAQTIETGSDRTQATDEHRTLQGGDNPGHQRAANEHRADAGYPEECRAEQ